MPRKLSDWLKAYIDYASYTEAPTSFHFWSGVWVVAGVLRRKVYFSQRHYIYTPNFYTVLVAPPAIGTKSTAIGMASRMLGSISGIHFGPNAMTRESLPVALDEAAESYEMEFGTYLPMSCLNFACSELGSLLDFQDRRMLVWLTDLWDGWPSSEWKKRTKTQTSESIPNPWVNILAGTTPDWLADNVPRVIVGGGFMSRCVFVYEAKKHKRIAYPADYMPPEEVFKEQENDLIHDLEAISILKGPYTLSPAAHKFGVEWYEELADQLERGMGRELAAYLARKQGHVHKLAMVLSAAKHDEMEIQERELRAAVAIVTALEPDMPKVFEAIYTTETQARVERMLEIVRAARSIPRAALYRLMIKSMSDKEYNEALCAGISAELIWTVVRGNVTYVEVYPDSGTPSQDHPSSAATPSQDTPEDPAPEQT